MLHNNKPLLILFFTMLSTCTYARNNKEERKGQMPNCAVSFYITGSPQEKISCRIYSYFFKSRKNIDASFYSLQSNNGIASLQFKIDKPSYISVSFESRLNRKHALTLYLIHPGDDLKISLENDSLSFSGNGSDRFSCLYLISRVPEYYWTDEEVRRKLNYEQLQLLANRQDSLYKIKSAILNQYKTKIGITTSNQIQYDLDGERLLSLMEVFYVYTLQPDPFVVQEAYRFYKERLMHQQIKTKAEYFVESKTYADAIYKILLYNLAIKNSYKGIKKAKPPLQDIFQYISNGYKGSVKERLITTALLDYKTEKESFTHPALSIVIHPYFRNILQDIQAAGIGQKSIDIEVEDDAGNVISLSDYQGKLVVINLWFTGCVPSADFEKTQMRIVRQKYRYDSAVVFLSISADKDKKLWKKTLASGLYSDDRVDKNCITNGLGVNHPLFNFFGFTGCPSLLIISPDLHILSKGYELINKPDFQQRISLLIDENRFYMAGKEG